VKVFENSAGEQIGLKINILRVNRFTVNLNFILTFTNFNLNKPKKKISTKKLTNHIFSTRRTNIFYL